MMNAIRRTSSLFSTRPARQIARHTRTRLAIAGLSLALFASAAYAQTPETALSRALGKVDLGISGIGQFTPNSAGMTYLPQAIQQVPSNTLGALIEIRVTHSRYIGAELNYSYSRFTENFNITNVAGTPKSQLPYVLGVQSRVDETSLGYIAHGPTYAGLDTFVSVGGGGIEFRPTAGGGQGLPKQARGLAYYAVGVQRPFFNDHFGLRAQFRQVFYGAPDFNQNYLAIGARTNTIEPGVGFYLRF